MTKEKTLLNTRENGSFPATLLNGGWKIKPSTIPSRRNRCRRIMAF